MTILIWTFSVSLVALIGMISYRYYELAYNKDLIPLSKRRKTDEKVLTFLEKSIILLNRLYKKSKRIPEIIGNKSHDLWKIISKKVDYYFERIKNNKSDNNKGSVSIYWQSVSEGRNKEEEKSEEK